MRKLENRAIICLILALLLLIGTGLFCFRFITQGSEWASYPVNKHLFDGGNLDSGTIYDRDGVKLLENTPAGAVYNDEARIRRATLHAVGDPGGNISTGAETKFAGNITGYNFVNGTYNAGKEGNNLYLTIDAEVCADAYEALGGRKGCVGVYNYKTGKLVCVVSSPSYDPNNPVSEETAENDGYYINRLFSATFVPGSVFKTVTGAAVIDTLDYENWSYDCTGSNIIEDDDITDVSAHGNVSFRDALCKSCNCGFADLTLQLGPDVMKEYVKKTGMTKSWSINGINTAKGSFDFDTDNQAALAWSGIGQSKDMVNPCALMIYMGSVANNGRTVVPQIINSTKTSGGFPLSIYMPRWRTRMISGSTAATLKEMLRNNVVNNYGDGNFPGLNLCAKSGTAEVGDGTSHSWFTGFMDDSSHPYAFVVLVEHGGSGAKVAGSVANRVLQSVINHEN